MLDHYGLEEADLKESNLLKSDLFKALDCFGFSAKNPDLKIGKLNLFYFVDSQGDFIEKADTKEKKIAKAVWGKLPIKDKIEIAEYINWSEENV